MKRWAVFGWKRDGSYHVLKTFPSLTEASYWLSCFQGKDEYATIGTVLVIF